MFQVHFDWVGANTVLFGLYRSDPMTKVFCPQEICLLICRYAILRISVIGYFRFLYIFFPFPFFAVFHVRVSLYFLLMETTVTGICSTCLTRIFFLSSACFCSVLFFFEDVRIKLALFWEQRCIETNFSIYDAKGIPKVRRKIKLE